MKSKKGKDNKNTKGKKTTTTKSKKEKIYKVNLEKPNNVNILKKLKNKSAICLPNGGYKRLQTNFDK